MARDRSFLPLALLTLFIAGGGPATAATYHTYDQLTSELASLAAAHPTRAQRISIGHGWETVGEFGQRQIWALKISNNVDNTEGKPEIVLVGNHHAREWISVEVPLAIGHYLLENYATNPAIQELVNSKVVWIVPMLNPDGHVYSEITNRCWRKNRRNNGDGTFGVDLNRNYGYQWGLASGSSGTTSVDTYRGPSAFSEPETQAFRDFLRDRSNLRTVISYHNYTQAVLRPWSYTIDFTPGNPPPPAEPMLKDVSDELRARLQSVHGQVYKDCLFQADRLPSGACPSPPHYESSGEMADWIHHELNIPAFTIEVRPTSGSTWPSPHNCGGFELPESEITPTVEENLEAALRLIHYAQPGDIMIRDHASDTGAVPSSVLTSSGWNPVFWRSPDIWSDPPVPVRGETATVTARVHNLSSSPVSGVTVQIWFTDPSITTEFPSPYATLLGQGEITLPASGTNEFSALWNVPSTPNSVGDYHWCVGVVIKHPTDLPLSTQAIYSNNVAFHNFAPVEATSTAQALRFEARNTATIDMDFDVRVTTERLPPGWRVVLDPGRPKVLKPGQRYLGFAQVAIPAGASAGEGIVSIHGVLMPQRPGVRRPIGSGVTYHVKYAPPDRLDPEALGLIRSHEELLKGQQRLLEKLGTVYVEVLTTRGMSDDRAVKLAEELQTLVRRQADRIDSFEEFVRRAGKPRPKQP
jgi:zinc carboxypeptidase